MIILISVFSLIETGLDSIYYRYLPIDTNIYERELEITSGGEMVMAGTKSFTISYGRDGLIFDQGMWVNFRGQTKDVMIEGSIADEEGKGEITRPLFEVENTRLGFQAPWGSGDFGDLYFPHHLLVGDHNQAGIGGRLRVGPIEGGLSVARGHYRYKRIKAEAHQGPYSIDPEGIIPGSETVYFDGIPLEKGVDYLIDYENGEITFTPKRPVTPINRIEIQYLSGDLKFLKLSGFGGVDHGKHRIGFITEVENKDRPIGIDLDPQDIELLERSGDTLIWIDGGDTLTGGDYHKVGDHYEFAGFGKGDYRVRFTYVGEGKGDYRYDEEIHAYRWVESGGDYVAKVKIRPPAREGLIYYRTDQGFGPIHLALEPSLSFTDGNLYSNRDPKRTGFGIGGRVESGIFFANFLTRDENYHFPLRYDYDLIYRWGMDSLEEVRSRYEAGIRFQTGGCEIIGSGGILNRRWPRGMVRINSAYGTLSYTRFLNRYRFLSKLEYPLGLLTPGMELLTEDERRIIGFGIRRGEIAKLGYRLMTDTLGNGREISFLLSPQFGPFRPELTLFRNRWEARSWDLLSIGGELIRPIYLSTRFAMNYELRRRYDEYYMKVKPGEGNYRLDTLTGRYIYDPRGDYIRKIHYLDRYDISRCYSLRVYLHHEMVSLDLLGTRDDLDSDLKLTGDMTYPGEVVEPSLNFSYHQREDRNTNFDGSELDLETGVHRYLTEARKVGPFLRFYRSFETEDGAIIQEIIKWGGKLKAAIYGRVGLDCYIGYDRIWAESPAYFPEIGEIVLDNPMLGTDLTLSLKNYRLDGGLELSYIYAPLIMGFFALSYPPGLSANYRIGMERKLGENSTVGVTYQGSHHPELGPDYQFGFATRIRF
ncbi:hypothetical protein DRP53_00325 [candidate division WOR-3 bacterium]|uniref:Uncharacterized protein n=1 Tax=candidate division WOR-3 bacterium TaxID=2052148 RepID=A0A660SNT8_UNCW3|nr:MAG: hypothetical protein DRP53_00325 [candidate division WOR-3 bacterium]